MLSGDRVPDYLSPPIRERLSCWTRSQDLQRASFSVYTFGKLSRPCSPYDPAGPHPQTSERLQLGGHLSPRLQRVEGVGRRPWSWPDPSTSAELSPNIRSHTYPKWLEGRRSALQADQSLPRPSMLHSTMQVQAAMGGVKLPTSG